MICTLKRMLSSQTADSFETFTDKSIPLLLRAVAVWLYFECTTLIHGLAFCVVYHSHPWLQTWIRCLAQLDLLTDYLVYVKLVQSTSTTFSEVLTCVRWYVR